MSEYNIKVELGNNTYAFLCSEDQDIISAAKVNGIDLPSSCCSGVCTSCASMVISGSVEQDDAMGLNDDLKEKGFARKQYQKVISLNHSFLYWIFQRATYYFL